MQNTFEPKGKRVKQLKLYLEGKLGNGQLYEFLGFLQTEDGQELLKQNMDEAGFSEINTPIPEKQSKRIYKQVSQRIKQPRKHFSLGIKIAASFLLLLALGASIYYSVPGYSKIKALTVQALEEQQAVTLPDGTFVRLNKGSRLSYSKNMMEKDKRQVMLNGEAFFEVAKNPDKPFIIDLGQAKVKVLGTVFNIKKGTKNNRIIVAVQEGKVSFSNNKQDKPVILTANEVGILQVGETIRKTGQPAQNYFSWFKHFLEFENMPLCQVVEQLETIFDTTIELAPDLGNKHFTAYMQNASIDEVMAQLALSMELKLEKTNGKYLLKK